jgi:hypothetical protein
MMFRSLIVAGMLSLSFAAAAQFNPDAMDWKEGEVPPPPAFDVGKLLVFDVSTGSSLIYGVDPATLRIGNDGIVRYVMVATSRSGARNVLYEGIRCSSGEFKTYARYSAEEVWRPVDKPEWRSMFGNMPSRHAVQLARTGACSNSAPTSSVEEIVRRLKTFGFSP